MKFTDVELDDIFSMAEENPDAVLHTDSVKGLVAEIRRLREENERLRKEYKEEK